MGKLSLRRYCPLLLALLSSTSGVSAASLQSPLLNPLIPYCHAESFLEKLISADRLHSERATELSPETLSDAYWVFCQICLGICKYPHWSSHPHISGKIMGYKEECRSWTATNAPLCGWLLTSHNAEQEQLESSHPPLDDLQLTADFTDKVNEEIINRGNTCCLYVPSLTESLPFHSCPVTSGVEGTQCHSGIQMNILKYFVPRIIYVPSEQMTKIRLGNVFSSTALSFILIPCSNKMSLRILFLWIGFDD